ncbi:RHS repeat-associated core domain-containing protein [Reyranella soli]|uniref:RHS repeat-associated core domain-containing protein n=1 Tax=Reyranella soli TaxID=1230389 RepID=UPI001479704D
MTDAEGRITQFTYDALSRPYRTYNTAIQAGPLVQRTYTADGLPATLTDANGYTQCSASNKPTCFAYDGFDRLATTTYPDGSTETFTYDALDNLLGRKTRASATTNIAFGYDTLNRLISKTPTSGAAVTYSYDLNSRPTGVSDNSAAINPAAPPGGSTVTYGTSYAYNALNRLTTTTWDPAPAATAPVAGPLVTFNHTYNKVNQRIGQTLNDNTWLSYPAATPATTAYTANSLNQYTAVGAVTPTYDGNGNLTSDGTYTLGYDLESRLTSANGAGNTATYAFDAQGRRKSRTINGTTTISVTDANNREVLEYDGSSGALLRWYAYGLGPNAVLNQMNITGGTRATLLPDQLGSIIASFASSTGALVKFGYQPYGTSAATATPFGYTGQRFDQESGLYYYRARHYSPRLGRFLQTDPTGAALLYAYVDNDPLNSIDPTGLAAESGWSSGGWGPSIGDSGSGSGPTTWSGTPMPASLIPTGDSAPYTGSGTPAPVVSPIQTVSPTQNPQRDPNVQLAQSGYDVRIVPIPGVSPTLDPWNLNRNSISAVEQQQIGDALRNIDSGIASSALNQVMNPHPYRNRPEPMTGAQLPPPSPQGYTTYYVNAFRGLPGTQRLVIDQGTGAAFYTNNHYKSFYPVIVINP